VSVRSEPIQHAGMRASNLSLILREVAAAAPLSRAQLAARTGLTKSSVSGLVADLLNAGLITEGPAIHAVERGRPGSALALERQGAAGLGLEVNVDYLAAVVTDLTGSPRYHHVLTVDNRGVPPADVLADLAGLARTAAAAAAGQDLKLAGACVAVPGAVTEQATLQAAPNLGWRDIDVVAPIASAVPATPLGVTVENEANRAALGELWFGHDNLGDFVHVSGEVGIGGGIVVGGELFRGARGMAGELGHFVLDPDGPPCSCGGRGCLERLAGLEAILDAASASSRAELEERCAAGDEKTVAAVALAGRHLGVALASVVNVLDPDTVVLGGAFATLAPWLRPVVEAVLRRHVFGSQLRPHVATSGLGTDAAIRGAAGNVVRRVLDDPATCWPRCCAGHCTATRS
jgi:predicted NBD/HSP70 family sugar kinase